MGMADSETSGLRNEVGQWLAGMRLPGRGTSWYSGPSQDSWQEQLEVHVAGMLKRSVAREGCVGPGRRGVSLSIVTVSLISDLHFPQKGFDCF